MNTQAGPVAEAELPKIKAPGTKRTPTERAERFYGAIFFVATLVSIIAFGGLLTVSALRTDATATLSTLISTQSAMQQVSIRLNSLDANDPESLGALGERASLLTIEVDKLSAEVEEATVPHPALKIAEERISFWAKTLEQNPSNLNLMRAQDAFQDASEILTDELLIIEKEITTRAERLLIALIIGYGLMGFAILVALYFLAVMFMSIRAILVWDEQMLTGFAKTGNIPVIPSIQVPGARFFPGATLLTAQSHLIASNFQAQVAKQSMLASKNARLSDELSKTVNELVHSREEFARSSQLAAVGKVAGSVSHEINNPVTGVLGYLKFIKKRTEDESLQVWIDKAIKEVERIGRIARSLLVFSRRSSTSTPAAFDIGPAVENVVTLMGPQMHEAEVEVIVAPSDYLPQAIGRVDELQQCLLNVLLNARYALLDKPQKKIWIDALSTGSTIEIFVTDSGTGIPPKVQENLFQPFFTTKPSGQGSGLGLAVAKELMTAMGGDIRFDKEHGPGARFVLSLPVFDAEKAAATEAAVKGAQETVAAVTAKAAADAANGEAKS